MFRNLVDSGGPGSNCCYPRNSKVRQLRRRIHRKLCFQGLAQFSQLRSPRPWTNPVFLGCISNTRQCLQIHDRTFTTFHQPHEEFRIRDLRCRPQYGLPTRIQVYSSTRDLAKAKHQSSNQGTCVVSIIKFGNDPLRASQDTYKQVYNWQYVHCVDFWSLVLARACGAEAKVERGGEASELAPLVYPLVQVTTGAIKLISNSRSYPYHFHLIKSLIHLVRHTHTYIPLTAYLLPIITSTLSTGKPKSSTLRPLDMETNIRAPQQLLRTRVYEEGLIEEATYLLGDYLSTRPIMGSIAFPEVVTPIVVTLRRALKTGKTSGGSAKSKEVGMVKSLVERVEESMKVTEKQRLNVRFGPGDTKEVDEWEERLNVEETPLGKYMKVQKKVRDKKRKLVEKVSVWCLTTFVIASVLIPPFSRRETGRMRCWEINHFGHPVPYLTRNLYPRRDSQQVHFIPTVVAHGHGLHSPIFRHRKRCRSLASQTGTQVQARLRKP